MKKEASELMASGNDEDKKTQENSKEKEKIIEQLDILLSRRSIFWGSDSSLFKKLCKA